MERKGLAVRSRHYLSAALGLVLHQHEALAPMSNYSPCVRYFFTYNVKVARERYRKAKFYWETENYDAHTYSYRAGP